MKEIKISKKLEILIKIIIILSFGAMNPLLLHFYVKKEALISCILCLIVAFFVFRKINIKKISTKKLMIALLIGAYVDKIYMAISSSRITEMIKTFPITIISKGFMRISIPPLLAVLSFPAIVFCIYWWIEKHHPRVVKEVKQFTKTEIKYLIIVS